MQWLTATHYDYNDLIISTHPLVDCMSHKYDIIFYKQTYWQEHSGKHWAFQNVQECWVILYINMWVQNAIHYSKKVHDSKCTYKLN